MDTLAHGLWGGAFFSRERDIKHPYAWAFFWGAAPDLFSFGPFFLTHLPLILQRWSHRGRMEPPDPSIIPHYVYSAYQATHSLVIWAVVFGAVWTMRKRIPWVLGAWGFHIICDIPTHSTRFFPTPFLWPLPTPFVNGRPWSRPPFMLINYSLIAVTYLARVLRRRRPANIL